MLQRCCETIAPCRFTYLAYVADELVTQCAAQHKALPQLVFSLDDMKAAYRQVLTSDPEMCIFCVYRFAKGNVGPRCYECWGHNFGHV